MRIHVAITADGQIRFLTTPELQGLTELGQTSTRRASHVVPQNRLLRLALPSASSGTASNGDLGFFLRRCTGGTAGAWGTNGHGPLRHS